MFLKRICILIGCFFLFVKAHSEKPIIIDGSREEYTIPAENLEILEDPLKSYSFEQVLSGNTKYKFKPTTDPFPHVVNFTSAYWVKFTILPNFKENRKRWIIEELDPHFTRVDFYLVDDSGNFIISASGINLPFAGREYHHKNFVFDVPLENNKRTVFYVRFEARDYNVFLFKLRTTNFFTHYALKEYYILGIYYGILFIMGLYNLLLFFTVKERFYLYYVLYVISCALISFSEDGIGFQYMWPNLAWLNPFVKLYSPLLFLFCFALYATSFLELRKRMPIAGKIVTALTVICSIYFLLDLTVFSSFWKIPVYAIPYLAIFVTAIISYRKGFRPARFFILGYSIILISIVVLILRMNGQLGWDNIFTIYTFNIGIVFEILVLSIALGDKIKIIKSEKDKAQQFMIVQLLENEKLKDKVNLELEEKVQERTKEINEQNEIISDQNKELSFANDRLLEQAQEIIRMNTLLNEENKTLVVEKEELSLEKEELSLEKEELIEEKNELEVNVKELNEARVLMKDVDFLEFGNIFPDKEACMKYLVELKWQNGYKCIRCDNEKFFDGHEPHSRRCTKCGHEESATAYTIFHRLRFPINKAFYLLFLVYSNKGKITSLELSQIVTLRQSTCWSFRKKIIEKMETKKKKSQKDTSGWSWLVLEES